jgi:CRISPR-associated protein (TIGR03986 family)
MNEGTIISYKNVAGQIKGDDGKTYDFNRKAITEGSDAQAVPGRRVRFEADGERARDVRMLDAIVPLAPPQAKPVVPTSATVVTGSSARLGAPTQPIQRLRPTPVGLSAPMPQPASSGRSYRFLNPYNFVRWSRLPQIFDDADTPLLARCEPPPHDRYVGLSGKIVCQLEAVSPLFISDSELLEPSQRDKEQGHKTFRFFHYDFGTGEEPALPASSLRGMIRSAFEAVTNSCYAHFDYGAHLTYHLPAAEALKLVPGRVEKDAQGRWQLRLLPGTARIAINDRPHDKLYAARVLRYDALASGRRKLNQPAGRQQAAQAPVALNSLKHGDRCYALAKSLQFPPVWNIRALAADRSQLPPGEPDEMILEGYLCINNQNIEAKRFERFFFRDSKNATGAVVVPLTEAVRAKYKDLIADYQERHKDTIKKWEKDGFRPDKPRIERKEAAFSRFVIGGSPEAKDGDLAYAMLSGSAQSPQVEYIVPVAVSRVGYERKVAQLLPRHLWKCEEYDQLCPACRTFGWVYGREDLPDARPDKQAAYAGRIRIEHGRLIESQRAQPPIMPPTTLAILSSPKPTTTRFYLKPSKTSPQKGLNDFQAGYDNPDNVLRGRKFYRHHGHAGSRQYWSDAAREYRIIERPNHAERSDQNRTVHDALVPGAKFEFTMRFENLAPVELGALLWTLEMNGAQYHRLGFGKPLGFGSVKISIAASDVYLLEPQSRYGDLLNRGEQPSSLNERADWVACFKAAMGRAYEATLEELPHIKDMLLLLSDPQPNLPIHYPRTEAKPVEEGKNFEWFMGNNRNRDARYPLEMPGEEIGLPLIDKSGWVRG